MCKFFVLPARRALSAAVVRERIFAVEVLCKSHSKRKSAAAGLTHEQQCMSNAATACHLQQQLFYFLLTYYFFKLHAAKVKERKDLRLVAAVKLLPKLYSEKQIYTLICF